MFANALRRNLDVAIAMIDVDHFKNVNDTYGHNTGDIVLCRIAEALMSRFRESDVVARMGGEEFCVLTSNMDLKHIHRVFDEVRNTIEQMEIKVDNQRLKITVRIGICTNPGSDLDGMVSKADALLYKAKESGRNRVIVDIEGSGGIQV